MTALLPNASAQAGILLHSLKRAATGIGLHVNAHKTEYMCFNETGDISTLGGSSETSRQVHLSRKQCLINRKRRRHAANKGMDSYRQAIGHMEVRPDRQNETQFLPSSGRVDTAIWMHFMDANKTDGEKALTAITQECCKQFWTSPGGNIPQSTKCTAINLPSRKLSKLDEPDIQDTAGETGTSSHVMFSYRTPHMAEQK